MTEQKPGYAPAVQPVATTATTTDGRDLETGDIRLPVSGGDIPAFHARPKAGGPHPVVIVVHEIFGLHEYIRDVCRRLARAGYFCVAPDLYQRQGDVTKIPDVWGIISKVVEKVPDEQVLADLDATVAWAAASPSADTARLGITGFCWGGRIVWAYSAHNPGLRAGVAWYGRLVGGGPLVPGGSAPSRTYPIDVAGRLHGPVLALFGDQDKSIPLPTIEQMRGALAAAGDPSQLLVYPGADHGFHADYRPQYHATAAADGWLRMLDWFRRHGVA